ncbi:hypothetical protein PG997_006366 [Apiospora hydei]|uniref:Uncharacterized protein n=1 Tax=Apiospora hydei TaxID=1337664 RepID=A0ABR1WNI9_9PEZI
MAPSSWSKPAYLWHAIIETPAALSFILSPKKQLPDCSPAAELILRQYGGLLLSSVLLSVVMLVSPRGARRYNGLFAAALGSYHLWPAYRAYMRLTSDVEGDIAAPSILGGPAVHITAHLVALALFSVAAIC